MGICGRFVCALFLSVGGSSPPPLFAFFDVLPRNEHFCALISLKRHCATAHKLVCVRVMCMGEGGKVSEQEKVDEITSYERLNAFFDVFACLPGFTWSLRPFF